MPHRLWEFFQRTQVGAFPGAAVPELFVAKFISHASWPSRRIPRAHHHSTDLTL